MKMIEDCLGTLLLKLLYFLLLYVFYIQRILNWKYFAAIDRNAIWYLLFLKQEQNSKLQKWQDFKTILAD